MKEASIILAIIAFIAGLRAAYLWYCASKVHVVPFWSDGQSFEPVDPVMAQGHWNVATQQTIAESGKFNQRAAMWTAVSIGISAGSTLIGAWA